MMEETTTQEKYFALRRVTTNTPAPFSKRHCAFCILLCGVGSANRVFYRRGKV